MWRDNWGLSQMAFCGRHTMKYIWDLPVLGWHFFPHPKVKRGNLKKTFAGNNILNNYISKKNILVIGSVLKILDVVWIQDLVTEKEKGRDIILRYFIYPRICTMKWSCSIVYYCFPCRSQFRRAGCEW